MLNNEIMLSSKFNKSLPAGRRVHTLRKLKYFFTVYADSSDRKIHTGARPMEIRGIPGVYKLRTSRGERVLYEVNAQNQVILREYVSHDNQIARAKNMSKGDDSKVFASLFETNHDGKEFDNYIIEPADESLLELEYSEIIIATDEWIAECEDTEDYIWLASEEQAQIICSAQYPQFISGSAGTGKTTVLFQKLCGIAQNKGNILYMTVSQTLKEDFQRLYEKFKTKDEVANISFLTVDELYECEIPGYKTAAQEQFLSEFSPLCQKMKVNPQDVWCEIEGIIKSHLGITSENKISFLDQLLKSPSVTLSQENYYAVKSKYTYFSAEQRNIIHEIAVKYDKWLQKQNLADINQIAAKIINSGVKPKYDLIMIDEVQDFTELQLYMMFKFAKSAANIIFCGDINQNVRPTFFMFERLYNIYYSLGCKNAKDNMYTLTKNYRSCKEIVVMLNKILEEQGLRIGFQGSKEDEGVHETGFRDGFSPLVLEANDENISNILNAICDKHYAIAIVPDEQSNFTLSGNYPEAKGRIFTVQEAKGLEYDVVFTINVTSAYEKEWQKILNGSDVKRVRRFRRFFGYIYVAASRARNHLIMTESPKCPFLEIVGGAYETLAQWDLSKVGLVKKSTADEFDRDADKLEKAGLTDKATAARETANKLRQEENTSETAEPYRALKNTDNEETENTNSETQPKILTQLAKNIFLAEFNGKQGIVNHNGEVIVKCKFDSIVHSAHKDVQGRTVFECRINNKILHYDRNGTAFTPVIPKAVKIKKTKKKGNSGKSLIISLSAAATLVIVSITLAIFYTGGFDASEKVKPHEPISDVIDGKIIAVAAGDTHSAALTEDGSVWMWGDSLRNISRGEDDIDIQPKIRQISIDNVISIAAGNQITAAIKSDGSLWVWGSNFGNMLRNGAEHYTLWDDMMVDSPNKILDDVKSVSLGDKWGLAVKNDGTLWFWGRNDHGGIGTISGYYIDKPAQLLDEVAEASAGQNHGVALRKDGTAWVWGHNNKGQLRSPESTSLTTSPEKIMDDIVKVSAGLYHTVLVDKEGNVHIRGENGSEQSGQIPYFKETAFIYGNEVVMTFSDKGELLSWGDTENFIHMESVAQASMYSNHFLAVKDDGSVWAFGANEFSQLGDGSLKQQSEPILIYPK
ncbi:MAG: UvrD-helicase domain-containing protein [Oscillospiraceae bacterium]|nr:UvrD-helicase domain-containing protein [Oscillospiraceae bacterium]